MNLLLSFFFLRLRPQTQQQHLPQRLLPLLNWSKTAQMTMTVLQISSRSIATPANAMSALLRIMPLEMKRMSNAE